MTSLLVLGGTQFLGRAVAEDALRRGNEVTVLHRGRNTPPPGVTALRGDRTTSEGLRPLGDRAWDIVVDTWSGDPSAVARSADLLRDRADRYTYISSRSVYTWPAAAGADEGAPVVQVPDDGELDYAQRKRAGELAVESAFGTRSLLLRVGLLIGPRE
ncbi:MAG: NAD-dependent epimerase/dehydratase family protein, partial [Actinomycetes bacterium]